MASPPPSSPPPPEPCPFLHALPVELRLQIYTYLLSFDRRLKLRQVIPGSRNLTILRVNRQVHAEATGVLFERNSIVVTRNDFCPLTDPTLQTPIPLSLAQNLHIASFSPSIACTLASKQPGRDRCAVCKPSATGLWAALAAMPKLRDVVVDLVGQEGVLERLLESGTEFGDGAGVGGPLLGVEGYDFESEEVWWRVVGESGKVVEGLRIRMCCGYYWQILLKRWDEAREASREGAVVEQ